MQLLLDVTESDCGFLAEALPTPRPDPILRTRALIGGPWSEQTQRLRAQARRMGMEFDSLDNLFGTVVRTGKPVVANNLSSLGHAMDRRPEGHPPLHHFLGLPLRAGDQLIGLIGVANRPSGYPLELAEWLAPFASVCAGLIAAYRTAGQKAQLESEREAFFENSRGMHVAASMQGYFLTVNPAFSDFLGWSRAHLCEQPIVEFVHPDDRQAILATMEQLSTGMECQGHEIRFLCRDGSYKWLAWDCRAARTPGSGGQVIYATARDITKERELFAEVSLLAHIAKRTKRCHSGRRARVDRMGERGLHTAHRVYARRGEGPHTRVHAARSRNRS